MITLHEIEQALDTHRLSIKMNNGNYWRVRRNGMTKRWITRPQEFRIPIKYGLKFCSYIGHADIPSFFDNFKLSEKE